MIGGMEPRGILTILEITRHPEFYRRAENSFESARNSNGNGRATLEQVRCVLRRVSHAVRELDYREIPLLQNVDYGVARS
jgi:hypothetical protein